MDFNVGDEKKIIGEYIVAANSEAMRLGEPTQGLEEITIDTTKIPSIGDILETVAANYSAVVRDAVAQQMIGKYGRDTYEGKAIDREIELSVAARQYIKDRKKLGLEVSIQEAYGTILHEIKKSEGTMTPSEAVKALHAVPVSKLT